MQTREPIVGRAGDAMRALDRALSLHLALTG
jgi:hypothetical protein